jgi:energy-coupling factor transporter ATP-binding protein EcfA2
LHWNIKYMYKMKTRIQLNLRFHFCLDCIGIRIVNNVLEVHNLCYTYPAATAPAISDVSFHVGDGECVCFTGHSGCGKSTLLLAVKGLLLDGMLRGNITHAERESCEDVSLSGVGLVFQDPESQLLCATVFDEVAFGPENLCLPPPEINQRIVEALTAVNLLKFGNRNVERFSAGQKQRLSIASVLSMHPHVILLDEPTSQLDRKGKQDLCDVLRHLKNQGIAIIITEHNIEPFLEIVDRYYLMDNGTISDVLEAPPEEYRCGHIRGSGNGRTPAALIPGGPVVSAEEVFVSYPGSGTIIHHLSLTIMAGELVHIFGENGCGKSTLLKAFAGALLPDSGHLRVEETNFPQAGGLLGTVALLFQNPQRQLFEDTVYDEVAFTLKRLKLSDEDIDRRVKSALAACEADHLTDRLPLTLSFGEQHRVALASVIAPDPGVLLLDEPFAGLDQAQRLRLLQILSSLRADRGTAIVIASHDPLPDPEWADRILVMEDGRIAYGEEHHE